MLKPRHLAITLREVACMQVISVNLGRIRETTWKNKVFKTAIFKEPVSEPVHVATLGVDGDQQANTTNHGRILKRCLLTPVNITRNSGSLCSQALH
jgi:MOSC domain-containing protein YiiM